jgi:hypothetical protein
LRGRGLGKNHRSEKNDHHSSKAADYLAHIGEFLSDKVEATAF